MSRTHVEVSAVLRNEYAAIYQFFASRRSYGYALAQENRYLASVLTPRNSAETST